ncbi:MAG TPA: hypothetical protein VNY51_06425 [Candidatus Dormibacteraeota bacterium]|nr:hypothetical protein [Candidatus Dormibacteraeota bacterium]
MRFLPYIPFFLQAFLLWLLVRRHAQRAFPFFFAYTAFGVAAGIARFVTLGHVRAYFWTYWLTDAVYILLGTLSLFEVFRNVFGHVTRVWWRHLIFPGIIAASVYLAMARMQAVPPQFEGARLWIMSGEIAVRFAQVITFAALGTLVLLLGASWNTQERGITAGFGMYATVMLLMTTRYWDAGPRFRMAWSWASIIFYYVALIIWIWSFRRPLPAAVRHVKIDSEMDTPVSGQFVS